MHYLDFTLDFVPDGKGGVAVKVADSPAGQGGLEPFDPPPEEDGLARGARLFEGLFHGSVRRLFDRSLGSLGHGDGLRIKIQLDLNEPVLAPLHSLPWELLFERANHHTFALDRRFSIVRFVPHQRMLDRRELPRPLRILLAGAEPRATKLLAIDDEIERIRKAVEWPGRIEVEPLVGTTLESLRRALTEGKEFHILHYMGHADFDPASGAGELLFEDGRRGTAKVAGRTLAECLRDRTSLRLVFLNACRSGHAAVPSPFGGVATALVEAGVPAVLAMHSPIPDSAAIAFSEAVYRCLAGGHSIDAAVTEGRHALARRDPDPQLWGAPVLFSHVADGRLFLPDRTGSPSPAPAAAPRPLHQLPAPPADFVGRETELAELRAAISSGGATICALQGMGGVGKTALALKVAHEFRDAFPDGQIYLDLRGMSDGPLTADEAAAHVIRSFHPEALLPEGPRLAALYREVLHEKRVLLLMDNAADGEQVTPLLPPATCALLVTSRRRFSLPGIFRWDLDQLPADDACAFLRRISPRAADQAPPIASLCGNLPFALRIAGSTLAERTDLPVSVYVQRLEQEGQKAKLGQAALGVSYALLPDDLQARFRALAIFPSSFDAAAAGAVWDLVKKEEETDEELGELIRRSLLDGEEGRYRLHDLARAFAGSNLGQEEEETARARHARHFLGVLSEAADLYLRGNEGILSGLSLFDRERAHILAAQAWAAARSAASDEAARLAGQFPSVGAHLLKLRLSSPEQIAWVEIGLAAARRLGDRFLEGAHLGHLGIACAALGETHRAIDCFEQHLAISRETHDRRGEGNALGNLGNAFAELRETRRAIDLFGQDLAIRRELGDRRGEGNALGNLGTAYADLGEVREAIDLYRQRIDIAHEIGDRRGAANTLWNLGAAYEKLGEIAQAIDSMQACVDFEREVGHPDAEKDAAHVEELRARAGG